LNAVGPIRDSYFKLAGFRGGVEGGRVRKLVGLIGGDIGKGPILLIDSIPNEDIGRGVLAKGDGDLHQL